MGTTVNANPTKEFFISMLTRDVDIKAAILELIDNSIDGAKRLRPNGDYSNLYIKIEFDKEHFLIQDNCGGIGIDIATNYAFRFGRSSKREKEENGQLFTGIFGIGMKRSLFRLGNYFIVDSKTTKDCFSLKVDVNEWVQDEDTNWTFLLDEAKEDVSIAEEDTGTTILVTNLHKGISNQFSLAYFYNSLVSHIVKYRTLAIENGLSISINGSPLVFSNEKIIQSPNVQSYSYSSTIETVKINIIAGIAPKGSPDNAGWYVYCNGRLVVFADKTSLTGWGEDGVRHFHNSLAFFRGFVFFESPNPELLPWNTTKTSVDSSSPLYIYALPKMRDATLQIIKDCHNVIEGLVSEEIEKELFAERHLMSLNTNTLQALTKNSQPFKVDLPSIKKMEPMANITFSKPIKDIKIMQKQMGVRTNKDVGIRAFDYYFEKECETDE